MGDETPLFVTSTAIPEAALQREAQRIMEERFVATYRDQRSLGFFLAVVAFGVVLAALPLVPAVRKVFGIGPGVVATGLALQIGAIALATIAAHRPGGLLGKAHRRAERFESFVIAAVAAAFIRLSGEATSVFWLISIMHTFFGAQDVLNARFNRIAHGISLGVVAVSFALIGRTGDAVTIVFIASLALFLARSYEKVFRETIAREAERSILRDRYEELLVERERGRIARDLHDGLGAQLASIAWSAEALGGGESDEALRAIAERARTSLTELREVVRGLKGTSMPLAALTTALRSTVAGLANGLARDVKHEGDATLSAELCVAITAMVREAVRNAVQHANARRVDVALAARGSRLLLRIEDDGRGLAENAVATSTGGLSHIRERANDLRGEATFSPGSEGGTAIVVTLPLA